MYKENYINSLRIELLEMVANHLTPIALRHGYSDHALEANIKWRPLVLVLGNYSSGKSALINEFLDAPIQTTGQAPTDDSFTVITYDESTGEDETARVTDERDGKFLLNDPEYPFEALKKHGQRFSAHFRLKKVNSPFLRTLAIIDTPGMLDSITQRDRGYNYQEVIGDLAQIADLILVLFDPHKAGTVREAHISLRDTLPVRTFEDRVLFVLNRIDECASLEDLLRVYGTLCWNLSQITGRKDIPMIHLTYSPRAAAESPKCATSDLSYLRYLENQRENLKTAVLKAPRHRLDNLATFVETHGERLSHFLEALSAYRTKLGVFQFKYFSAGLVGSVGIASGALFMLRSGGYLGGIEGGWLTGMAAASATVLLVLWTMTIMKWARDRFHRKAIAGADDLTPIGNQTRRDSWQSIKDLVIGYLERTGGRFSTSDVRQDHATVRKVYEKGSQEIREALSELNGLMDDEAGPVWRSTDEIPENGDEVIN